jgi:hypothetical protein
VKAVVPLLAKHNEFLSFCHFTLIIIIFFLGRCPSGNSFQMVGRAAASPPVKFQYLLLRTQTCDQAEVDVYSH